MTSGPSLGIDFGTTQSSAVIIHEEGRWSRVDDPTTGHWSVPSAVYAQANGGFVVGQAAVNLGTMRPGSFVSNFKRDMAEAPSQRLTLGRERLLPAAVAEIVFGFLRERAELLAPGTWDSVVACVPAAWEESLRERIRVAVLAAGFPDGSLSIVEEPVAAARFALTEHPGHRGDLVLVYDFGGGTFDAALVEVAAYGQLVVRGHHGIDDCGGMDIDTLVMAAFATLLVTPEAGTADSGDQVDWALHRDMRLAGQAREAKHHLSSHTEWASDFRDEFAAVDVRLTLTRDELETLALPLVNETLAACDDLLASHGTAPDDLTRVIAVGGMSRMPAVGRRLAEHLGRPVLTLSDPELAIAQGAALVAASRHQDAGQDAGQDGPAGPDTEPDGWALPELAPVPPADGRPGGAPDSAYVHASFLLAELLWESDRGGDAAQWYQLAAAAGHARAAYQLGWLRRYAGDGEAAATWWEQAALRGDAEAAYYLGELAWKRGDPGRAQRWFLLASRGGHGHAAYQLGWLHKLNGDLKAAQHFWEKAEQAGDREALAPLKVLRSGKVPGARELRG